ncbi:MAG: hypothetical protein AB1467_00810 [Candidatus Diapherotrites archaeon]
MQTKAAVLLSMRFSAWIAFFFGFKEENIAIAITIASMAAGIILMKSFKYFEECKNTRKEISRI